MVLKNVEKIVIFDNVYENWLKSYYCQGQNKIISPTSRFMIKVLLTPLFLGLSLASFSQIYMPDSTAQVIPYWTKGESQSYSVTIEKVQLNKSDTLSKNELSYDLEITVKDDSEDFYILEWRYHNFQSSETNPLLKKILGSTENMKIVVQTNALGMYEDLLNSDEISAYVLGNLESVKEAYHLNPEMEEYLTQFAASYSSKENIWSSTAADIKQYLQFYGYRLKLGEPLEEDIQVQNAFSTVPIDAHFSILLESINESTKQYTIRSSQILNSRQLAQSVFNFLNDTAKTLKKDPPKWEEFKNIERETHYTYVMNNEGWLIQNTEITVARQNDFKEISQKNTIRKTN